MSVEFIDGVNKMLHGLEGLRDRGRYGPPSPMPSLSEDSDSDEHEPDLYTLRGPGGTPNGPRDHHNRDARDEDRDDGGSMSDIGYGGGPSPDIKIGIEELCPVCGDKVSGYHYGLQTCESCKGFFKRTVQNKKVYSCVDNRNCLIDKTQRKRCPYCRFQKCISVGMKLEAVRADRMRGGRNKFGPMYKRDRALKQQAIRQRQQMFAQMQYTMQFNGLQGPPGMPPGMMDGYMGPNSDIKPNIAMLGLPSPHEGSPPGHMGPPGPPPPGYYHPRGMYHDGPLSPNGLPHPPASLHQSSHGGYLPPPGPPPGPPQHHYPPPPPPHNHMMMNNHGGHHSNTSSSSSMPPPHPAHHPLPPDMDRHLPPPPPPPHSNHGDLVSMATGVPSVPSPPPPATNSGVPQLIRDLQKNEPDPHDIQVKLAGIADMMMAQTSLHGDGALPGQDSGDGELSKSMLQLVCRICDQALFLLVEWARGAYFFRDLRVEDQMKLLQNCWSELLILDFVFKQMAHSKPRHLLLGTGHMVSIDALDQVGLSDVKERLVDLASKLRDLKLDHNEFTCLKFLILLNPDVVGLLNRAQVEDYQKKVNLTLLDYCTAFYGGIHDKCGQLLIRLPEVRLFSLRAEDYLYFQHISGNIPENTLLMEMLHSKRK